MNPSVSTLSRSHSHDSALSGKRILVLEALSGGAALVREAVDAGALVTIVTSELPDCETPSDIRESVQHVVRADTTDASEVIRSVRKMHEENRYDAVFPGCDAFVIVAAQVATAFGVRGHDSSTVERLQNKYVMRAALQDAGVRAPAFQVVGCGGNLSGACDKIGFPAVVKPLNGSGSWHVRRVDSVQSMAEAVAAIHNDEQLDMGFRAGEFALVEEYISGPEFSVEGFVDDGKVTVVAVTEKMLGSEPYFVETGHIIPARIDEHAHASIEDYIKEVIDAVNLTWGVFHIELRITQQGPVLIEIGARLGGDQIWDLVETATGVNLANVWLHSALHLGAGSTVSRGVGEANFAAIKFIAPDLVGRLVEIKGMHEVAALPGVVAAAQTAEPGYILNVDQDFSNRIGFVKCATGTREELESIFLHVDNVVSVVVAEGQVNE